MELWPAGQVGTDLDDTLAANGAPILTLHRLMGQQHVAGLQVAVPHRLPQPQNTRPERSITTTKPEASSHHASLSPYRFRCIPRHSPWVVNKARLNFIDRGDRRKEGQCQVKHDRNRAINRLSCPKQSKPFPKSQLS